MVSINDRRLIADLEALGQIGRVTTGGLNRSSFSAADSEARKWYRTRCAEAGLEITIDGIGNLFVEDPSVRAEIASRPAVLSGSHIDTVPNGGRFDGALGVLAALECIRRIKEEGLYLARPVRAVVYSDEESCYGHLLGSSALVKSHSRSELERMVGRDNEHFVDAFVASGGDVAAATRTQLDPASLHVTVELHIEQGPVLEGLGHQIGVVTGIVGFGGGVVTFHGQADHAGTTPMTLRKDALSAAAEFLLSLPDLAAGISDRAVVTSGIITLEPRSSNVIPGLTHVTVDFRAPEAEHVAVLERAIASTARSIAARRGLEVSFNAKPKVSPCLLDITIQQIITEVAATRGLSWFSLPSGAGHDSQNMAKLVSTGMIFVPSVNGRSHCPEEYSSVEDVVNGANVLLDTLLRLAGS